MMDKLNAMIECSNLELKSEEDFWFSYKNQRKHIYNLATRFYVDYDMDAASAIEKSEQFINLFYKNIIKQGR